MMISLLDIRDAMAALLKSAYPDWKVHFDNVERPHAPYFYVELDQRTRSVDDVCSERSIAVVISAVLPLNRAGRVSRRELFEIADRLDGIIRPVFRVRNRAITVLDGRSTSVDDILHYYFDLNFVDAVEVAPVDKMEELEFDLTMKGMKINGE